MGKSRRIDSYRKIDGKWAFVVIQGFLLTCLIAFLFYKSIFGLLVGVVVMPFWIRLNKEKQEQEKKAKTAIEFKEYIMLIVSGLQAGYSLEKAFLQAEKELIRLYPKDSVITKHVHEMNQKIGMNIQIERAFDEFAKAIELQEAESLADIISFAKRSGGNYGKNIRETGIKIEENLAVKEEIETITTEKRLELKVMCFMPMGILAYISLTSSGFIAPLYGNIAGVFLMTICLLLYGILILVGRKIIEIKV